MIHKTSGRYAKDVVGGILQTIKAINVRNNTYVIIVRK